MMLLTEMLAVALVVEKAVVLPVAAMLAEVCTVPLLPSHPRSVNVGVPPSKPSGLKRTRSLPASSSALLSLTVPSGVQLLPLSVEYSQLPVPTTVLPVMAAPALVPRSTSLKLPPSSLATLWPVLPVSSSVIPAKSSVALVSVGASFTALTLMLAVLLAVEKALALPVALASAVAPAVPLVWSQAW